MKINLWFFLLLILVLTGLICCVKKDPPPLLEDSAAKVTDAEKGNDQKKDSSVFDNHPFQKIFTTYVAIISGNEVTTGFMIRNDVAVPFTSLGVCWSTSPNPTINDNKAEDGSLLSRSHCHITGLMLNTTYYLRAFIVNNDSIDYGDLRSFTTPQTIDLAIFNPDLAYGSVSDIDGNVYKTIKIGNQTWMAENLKTTRYNDGSQIPNVIDNSNWVGLKTGAYRWYENDEATFKNLYGAMYNWYTVNTGKLCPTGWHVPSDDEWKILEMEVGMTQAEADSWGGEEYGDIGRGTDQGTRMRATSGWSNWEGMYGNGTNKSGFSALPGGDTGWYGWYEGAGQCTSWWTSTQYNFDAESATNDGVARVLGSGSGKIGRSYFYKHIGFSVRCLKD